MKFKKNFFEWNFGIKYLNDVLNHIFNSTPLYKAIEIENIEIIKILLSKEKIDVNRISIYNDFFFLNIIQNHFILIEFRIILFWIMFIDICFNDIQKKKYFNSISKSSTF